MALLLAVAGLGGRALGSTALPRIVAPPQPASIDATVLLATIRDPQADRAARADAATRLFGSPLGTEPVGVIATLLSDPSGDGLTKTILLDAMARSAAVPLALYGPVAVLVGAAGNEDLPFIAPALGSFRTRDSARLLLNLTDADRPTAVRSAAFAALARLSGRDDLGSDGQAWRRWLDASSILSESDWREQLATDQVRRADHLAASLNATQQQLAPIYRRLYGQLSPAERPRLLAEMLKDEREELRTLGFQIAALELSSGQSLPAVVSDAAVALLGDSSPRIRAQAAVLLDQIARAETSGAVIDALTRETDPTVASALLAAAARWPSPVARACILGWLTEPATRPAASRAALSLLRGGLLDAPADRAQAAASLRAVPLEQLGGPELRLLVLIGSDSDREKVADMLGSFVAGERLAAAEALTGRAEFLDRLIAAAARDTDLFSSVAESAASCGPTAATYRAVAALRAPDLDTRRAALILIAKRLSTPDLLIVARETEDPEFATALLDRVPDLAASATARDAGPVAEAIAVLADLRLQLGQPDRTLAALDLLDTLRSRFPDLPRDQSADLRVTAFLCLDRLDRAVAFHGSAASWIRGLSLCKDQPQARAIATEVRTRFADGLTPDQMVEFALLESQIAAFEEEERARMVGPPEPNGRR